MPSSRQIKDPVRYKTVLCEKFLANGACPYGHKCQFAHGTDELRERGEKKEKKAKRSRAEVDAAEPVSCQPCTKPAAPAASPPLPPPSRPAAAALRLPPGLGIEATARKAVTWAPAPEVMSLSTPPTNQPPSPSTPLAENEPPQTASRDWTAPRPACEPAIRRNDSGLQPKVGINSLTGKIELTRVGRQASHTTDGIRRQLSLLFADEPDEIAAAPTSSAIWRHDHFGMPPVGAV